MSLKTAAQAALAAIIAANPEAVLSIVANGNTASGLKDSVTGEAALGDGGEIGTVDGAVFCNADTIGALKAGQSITAGGAAASVMRAETDPAGAVVRIEYQLQKPK